MVGDGEKIVGIVEQKAAICAFLFAQHLIDLLQDLVDAWFAQSDSFAVFVPVFNRHFGSINHGDFGAGRDLLKLEKILQVVFDKIDDQIQPRNFDVERVS